MLFCHLADLIALFSLSHPIFLSNSNNLSFTLNFFPHSLSLSLHLTENLSLMHQTVQTVTELFHISLTDPQQLDHLKSQVFALTRPLSHSYQS